MRRDDVLKTALDLFRERGYSDTSLQLVAERARVGVDEVRAHFGDKEQLLNALLQANSPTPALEAALDTVLKGADGKSAEDLLREAMHQMLKVTQDHSAFFELAVIDAQVNNGAFLASLSAKIFPKAMELLTRLKATGELRPVSDPIFGRTMIAMLMGFVVSERAVPQLARLAMRLFPQRAWMDGMIDLLLYGVLENKE